MNKSSTSATNKLPPYQERPVVVRSLIENQVATNLASSSPLDNAQIQQPSPPPPQTSEIMEGEGESPMLDHDAGQGQGVGYPLTNVY